MLKKSKALYIVAGVASILASWTKSVAASILGSLFDLMGTSSNADLCAAVWKLGSAYFAQAGLSYLSTLALAVASNRIGREIRERFFTSILKQDISFFDEISSGELTHQLSHDVGSLQTATRTSFTKGIDSVTSLVTCSYYLWCASPKLAIAVLSLLPVMALAANSVTYVLRSISSQMKAAANRASGIATETFSSVRTVRSFTAEERECKRYADALDEASKLKFKMAVAAGSFYSLLALGINLTSLLVGAYGGYLVTAGELSRGDIASALTQVMLLERAMARISMVATDVAKAVQGAVHIFDMMDRQPVVNVIGSGSCPKINGSIDINRVSFSYPSRPAAKVLNGVSLHCKMGEVVALVGPSGSGKTTITSLIERFYDVNEGSVRIDGIDIKDIDPHWLRRHVSIVSQEPSLWRCSILENIRYGRPNATDDEIYEAARRANADDFIREFPEGYATELGERGVLLSGGQKQRIAIARALLSNPKILLLDEATSALDNQSERLVQEALDELMVGRTVIVIAHRLSTIRNADRIYVMHKGGLSSLGATTISWSGREVCIGRCGAIAR